MVYLGHIERIRKEYHITIAEFDCETYSKIGDTFIPNHTTNLSFWKDYIDEINTYEL